MKGVIRGYSGYSKAVMFKHSILRYSLIASTCLVGMAAPSLACEPDQYCRAGSDKAYNIGSSRSNAELDQVIDRAIPKVIEAPKLKDIQPVQAMEDGLIGLLQNGSVEGVRLKNLNELRSFYEERGFDPYWTRKRDPRRHAKEMVKLLGESWTHGLNPYSYEYEKIAQLHEQDGNQAAMQALDVLLSDAYIEYARDLSGIRVNPASLKSHKRFWQQPLQSSFLIGLLNQYDFRDSLRVFTPQGNTYQALRRELIALADEPPETYEAVLPISMKGLLRPYEEHRVVKDLRIRFDAPARSGENPNIYDDALAAKVMAFQRESGLDADGVVGPATLRAVNKSRKDKMAQIIANLERLRWVPENKPDKFVIVNVPSAMLWAVEGGDVAFEMPVVVGRKKRPTNIFVTDITGLRLNPTWTVPPTIKKEDILPKLIKNRNYLKHKGMELVYGHGSNALTLDPTAIDWTTVTEAELKTLRMIQTPGAHNPLGSVRVLMPNSYNIYLHDTNEQHSFNSPGRAASSGCVRLKRPMEMADFIMREKPGWSREDTDAVLAKGKIRDIYLPKDALIPVYIVYYTAWLDDEGELIYGNDLYGYDEEIIKMLSNLDEIFIPVDNTRVIRGKS